MTGDDSRGMSPPACPACHGAGCNPEPVRSELTTLDRAMVLAESADFTTVATVLNKIAACPVDAHEALFGLAADLYLARNLHRPVSVT